MTNSLPSSVRYIKNGPGGRWWAAAKSNGQLHAGWKNVPIELLLEHDFAAIESLVRAEFGSKPGATQDFKALCTLLDHPSQHTWITFEDGCLWWCTVHDGIEGYTDGENADQGHFWLACALRWNNRSLGGRHLILSNLPGVVTATAGYKATVCKPKGWKEILRIILDEEDEDVIAAEQARATYEDSIAKLVARLRDKDFELLIDLILARDGWAKLAKLGGTTEGIDIEVEHASTGEVAFVQIKSAANKAVLNDYVARFNARRDRYSRMIFAVHSAQGDLTASSEQPVQVWDRKKIAQLVVRLGLGDWLAKRI